MVSRARALLGLAPFVGLHQGDVRARTHGALARRGAGTFQREKQRKRERRLRFREREGNVFLSPLDVAPLKKKKTQKKIQAKLARNEVSWIQRVYSGETMQGRTPSLDEACAGGSTTVARPTLEEFRHLTAVVASYAFHLPDDEGTDRTVMLPLLDLVNHANAGVANAIVAREGEDFTARALRDIREGEEVSFLSFFLGEKMRK